LGIGLLASSVHAAEPAHEEGSPLDGFMDWLDEQHAGLSERVIDSATAIDRFFATEEYLEDTNASYLQVIMDLDYDTVDEFGGDVRVRGKLDLPGSKRRFSLIISGDTDNPLQDELTPEDERGSATLTVERNPRDGMSGWEVRPGLGIKGGWPPDAFAQLRATRYDDLADGWRARTQGTARYLVDDQWDLRAEFSVAKKIDDRLSWRSRTGIRYEDTDGYTKASQAFDLYHTVDRNLGMRHTLFVDGNDEDDWNVDSYGYRFTWRRLIHADWLYFEVSPEVYFPRDEDYDAVGAVLFRLEGFVGSK
jgi:hypothetical protein